MTKGKDPLAPQPEPAPTRGDSAEIVEAIVAAALAIGDPEASVNAIAAKAGVGVASLYRYFPSKAAIYAEISRRLQRDFLRRLREVLESPSVTVEEAILACCRIAVEVPGVSTAIRRSLNLTLPMSWSEDNAGAMIAVAVERITEWLAARMPSPPPDLAHRVFVAFSSARGLVIMSQLCPSLAPDDEAMILHMARGISAYLGLPAPVAPVAPVAPAAP